MRTRPGSTALVFAIILTVAAVASVILFRNAETPPWNTTPSSPAETERVEIKPTAQTQGEFTPFTFIAYNVKNWLVSHQAPEKSPEAKAAIIELLASGKPDVIGLCEIGSKQDVIEIQAMLKAAGIDLPHFHHAGGVDRVRHLALISRFPILSTESPNLSLAGMEQSMQRGILDATLDIGGRPVRFIGLHLKSKRTVPEFDQAALRVAEAQRAREHLDTILTTDPRAAVVAYGDFNDTTRSLSTRAIYGKYRTPGYMSPVHIRDSRGETWTYRYAVQDA